MRIFLYFLFLSTSFSCNQTNKVTKNPFLGEFPVIINKDKNGNLIGCQDSVRSYIFSEFELPGTDQQYAIEILEDTLSFLRIKKGIGWQIIDTIDTHSTFFSDTSCHINYPNFTIKDFNKDGYADIVGVLWTNINGNLWSKLYLFNPKTEKLQLLKSAEPNNIWAAPEYDSLTEGIKCFQSSGVYGLTYESYFKLTGTKAIPVKKEEDDTRNIDPETGKGGISRTFIGVNGKWVLKDLTQLE